MTSGSRSSRSRGRLAGAVTVAVLGLSVGLAGCVNDPHTGPVPSPTSGTSATPTHEDVGGVPRSIEVVASGLEAPWSIAFAGETPLVSERDSARVLELLPDGSTRVVATVDAVRHGGEGGLLGIAVHRGFVYAYFTAADGNRIARFALLGAPGDYALGDADVLVQGIPAGATHNGGRIAFGPDGMLYATAGDAGNRDSAQDLDALSGKILRMTPDGAAPRDNPFSGSLVYSYGHRNPQGIAWAPDGTLYASEFGQNTWDELNVIEPGANYGWPDVEGVAARAEFTDPVQQWEPDAASPSGIAIHGDHVHIANLRGQRLRTVPLSDPATASDLLVGEYGRLRDVVVAPDGALWVLTNNTDGRGDPGADDDRIIRLPG